MALTDLQLAGLRQHVHISDQVIDPDTGDPIEPGGATFATPAIVLGAAAAAGVATTVIRSDSTIAAFDATVPVTQAFADAAAAGSAAVAARRDHRHGMPTLTTASAFATATTSISAATYADITGVSVSLVAGTWLVFGTVTGSVVNAHALMHVALTHSDNTVIAEASGHIAASGTASVASNGTVPVVGIVTPGSTTTYKLRAARGLTTLTTTWTVMDGAGTNITNNLTDNSDKGTGMFAVRIA